MIISKLDDYITKRKYSRINEARTNAINTFEQWEKGKEHRKSDAIWTDGEGIYSHAVCLVAKQGNTVVFNTTKYSKTASDHQDGLRFFLSDTDFDIIEISDLDYGVSAQMLLMVGNLIEKDPDLATVQGTIKSAPTSVNSVKDDMDDDENEDETPEESDEDNIETKSSKFPMPDRLRNRE